YKLAHVSFQTLFLSMDHLVKVSLKNWYTFLLQKTAVATDGDQPCPTRAGKDLLLSWLAEFSVSPIVTAQGCFPAIVWIVVSCLGEYQVLATVELPPTRRMSVAPDDKESRMDTHQTDNSGLRLA